MKTLTLFLLTLITIAATHAQTIRIADNNVVRPTGTNVYSTLQAAINAAQPDDIVYITPSNLSYGDVLLAKRITLQGVGFNTGLGDRTSTITTLTLNTSTDGVNSIAGAILREFNVTDIYFSSTGIGTTNFDNIIFEKLICRGVATQAYGFPTNRSINNLTIRNCLFTGSSSNISFNTPNGLTNSKIYNNVIQTFVISGTGILNNTISNNIFNYNGNSYSVYTGGTLNNTLFVNNVFAGSGSLFNQMDGVTFGNNIFYGGTPTPTGTGNYFRDNNFSNNLVTSSITMPPAGNGGGTNSGVGNVTGVSPNFVSVASTTWDATYDYSLNTGSPAKNAGSDGTDIGPTGGAYPINKNIVFGPSALPLITELNTSGVIPQNQPLKANLKAKSN